MSKSTLINIKRSMKIFNSLYKRKIRHMKNVRSKSGSHFGIVIDQKIASVYVVQQI